MKESKYTVLIYIYIYIWREYITAPRSNFNEKKIIKNVEEDEDEEIYFRFDVNCTKNEDLIKLEKFLHFFLFVSLA